MSLLLLSLVVVLAPLAGLAVATVIAGIPLEILTRAAFAGRYAGLAAADRSSPVGPSSGRRIPGLAAPRGAVA